MATRGSQIVLQGKLQTAPQGFRASKEAAGRSPCPAGTLVPAGVRGFAEKRKRGGGFSNRRVLHEVLQLINLEVFPSKSDDSPLKPRDTPIKIDWG